MSIASDPLRSGRLVLVGEARPEQICQRVRYGEQKSSFLTPALARKSTITSRADRLAQGGDGFQIASCLLRL